MFRVQALRQNQLSRNTPTYAAPQFSLFTFFFQKPTPLFICLMKCKASYLVCSVKGT